MLKELGFMHGVNLGGWLSQCDYSKERLEGFIHQEDLARIASWGADHVRLPVDVDVVQTPEGKILEEGLGYIDRAMDWAEKAGLGVVLDLHKAFGYSFDAEGKQEFFTKEANQELFYALWEVFARRYGARRVMFDLLNEVTLEEYLPAWERIARECIRRIRAIASTTPILLGSYNWNGVREVAALGPLPDKNVLFNFHCYEPMAFTHQGAYWAAVIEDKAKRVTFAECGASPEYFEAMFATALEKAKAEGTELYCGEYGVIDCCPTAEALKWYQAIQPVFEKYGIGRATWSYKEMDFGLTDARWDDLRDQLVKYL